ncbi:MAG TPA: proton-conducting transporter membrane subunit [Lacunisphaera sp.]|jgi:hydrogenase-4 component B|nr:proton-conducting transporter membrane subunit [Lacunisphaera sp.]
MSVGYLVLVAAVAMLAGIGGVWLAPRLWLAATVTGLILALAAAVTVLAGGADWDWAGAVIVGGQSLHLRLDGISALFLALLGVVGSAASLYAHEYWTDAAHPHSARAGRLWWSVLLLSLLWILLAANGLHFLIAWELFTLSAYFLITLERERSEVRSAGWLYLGASHAAVLALFAFFAVLAVRTGSWELGPMRDRPELAPLFWLALFGFGLKAGLFPLHIWLPSAHANAPSHVSAILSGVTIKMGIYGLVRFSSWMPLPAGAGWTIALLGVVSAVLGVAFALGQHDLKRLLAYHSVENIGIILIGLGFAVVAVEHGHAAWGLLALAGGLLHVWNHGLFKALLFLGAGSVLHATGTREMSQLGGLWKAMPWTAGLFALGAAAISGLPPLNGFVSEWLVYLGLFDAALGPRPAILATPGAIAGGAMVAAILLGMTGALALACFVKVCGVVFLGAPRSARARRAHECGAPMRSGMLVLAATCALTGLAPVLFWPAVARAVGVWNPAWAGAAAPGSLAPLAAAQVMLAGVAVLAAIGMARRVRAGTTELAPTWDCGYVAPTPRMQYTAGSFAGIITEWFDWILRPVRHEERPVELFPAAASYTQHTPETVLEHVVEPAAAVVGQLALAARRLQHGRLQSYLLYVVAGLAALALLVWAGGAS